MSTEKQKELLPPKLVLDLWAANRPGKQPTEWTYLNEDHKDSEEWGAAIYKVEGEDCDPLYVALQATTGQLSARELTVKEIRFLETGEIPEEDDVI